MKSLLPGTYLIAAAQQLILDVLSLYPDGLTNAEIDEKTGLNLPVKSQHGYITWTLLSYLVQKGLVVKEGKVYKPR